MDGNNKWKHNPYKMEVLWVDPDLFICGVDLVKCSQQGGSFTLISAATLPHSICGSRGSFCLLRLVLISSQILCCYIFYFCVCLHCLLLVLLNVMLTVLLMVVFPLLLSYEA